MIVCLHPQWGQEDVMGGARNGMVDSPAAGMPSCFLVWWIYDVNGRL